MVAKVLISQTPESRIEKINQLLFGAGLKRNHPDVLYFENLEKLGIDQVKKIKDFFSVKPFSGKGKAVVLENSASLTIDAQNALLKTIEELPENNLLILGAKSEAIFLPTILSRCQIIKVQELRNVVQEKDDIEKTEKFLAANMTGRFEYIEKLKDKEEFLKSLVWYFHQNLRFHPKGAGLNITFLRKLLRSEEWADKNVNIRTILEYLALIIPSK